jgi:hypothetical protein
VRLSPPSRSGPAQTRPHRVGEMTIAATSCDLNGSVQPWPSKRREERARRTARVACRHAPLARSSISKIGTKKAIVLPEPVHAFAKQHVLRQRPEGATHRPHLNRDVLVADERRDSGRLHGRHRCKAELVDSLRRGNAPHIGNRRDSKSAARPAHVERAHSKEAGGFHVRRAHTR